MPAPEVAPAKADPVLYRDADLAVHRAMDALRVATRGLPKEQAAMMYDRAAHDATQFAIALRRQADAPEIRPADRTGERRTEG